MKKLLSTTLLLIFSINSLFIEDIFALDKKATYVKQIILNKTELDKTKKWRDYVNAIDLFVENISNNQDKLLELSKKLEKTKWIELNDELKYIVSYLEAKVSIAIINLDNTKIDSISKTDVNSINDSDKKLVEAKIMDLQKSIAKLANEVTDKTALKFDEIYNYEENWNFKMNLDLNHDLVWKFKSELKLNNYTAKNSNIDTQLKWEFFALIEALPKWWEEVKVQFQTFLDFISKDWNIYLLLKDLKITNEKWIDDMKETIEKVKKIAEQNKYIKYNDANSEYAIKTIKNISPKNIKSDINNLFSWLIFEPYEKSWDKYYIKPTKYACDSFKKLANKFDPINWENCTESQYKNLIKDLNESWKIYISFSWDKNIIWFEWKKFGDIEKNNFILTYNTNNIEKIYWELIPDQKKFPNEFLKLDFVNKEKLDVQLSAKSEWIEAKFISKLDSNNKPNFINALYSDNINKINLSLNNNIIKWDFKFEWFNWDISWNTNNENLINILKINYTYKDLLKWKFNLNWKDFYLENIFSDNYFKSNIKLSWNLDNDYIINNLILEFNAEQKNWKYDENWEIVYDKDFSKIIDIKFDIKNKNISWLSTFYYNSKPVFILNTSWNYTAKKLELKNIYKIESDELNYIIWTSKVNWELNIWYNFENDNSNINIFYNLKSWTQETIKFELSNISKRKKGTTEIKTPTNTINYDEIFIK